MKYEYYLNKLKKIYNEYCEFDSSKIPLCAAETYVSPFSLQGLISKYEGKYISGNLYRNKEKDFIGSDHIEKLLNFANELGKELFDTKYNDFRCLSGMNTVAIILMSLVRSNAKILITSPEAGGHGSLPKLCDALNVSYETIPYDFSIMQIKYDELNSILSNRKDISFMFFCQSDLIIAPDFKKINLPENVGIIYDATQTLGLIAGKAIMNPVNLYKNIILIGGTHKTFPGVTCGFIATNNEEYINKIDKRISPDFLRNPQVNSIASICLSMIELIKFGEEYAKNIILTANSLGSKLSGKGIKVKKIDDICFTSTHQIYIEVPENQIEDIYLLCKKFGLTLNKRKTEYVNGFRLGVQEIARYGWKDDDLEKLSTLLHLIINYNPMNDKMIMDIVMQLSNNKTNKYYIGDIFMELD